MAKKNVNKEKEKELFESTAAGQEPEVKVEEPEVKVEDNVEGEMELELDGSEVTAEMEEVVSEKVKEQERKEKEQKSKRGPKEKSDEEKAAAKAAKAEKEGTKEKVLNLKDQNIIQREIKKGRLSAPCYRIEKVEGENVYHLLASPGIIFASDAKYKKYDSISKMVEGKVLVSIKAVKENNDDLTFKAKHQNGEEVIHDWVRVELHKPGRDKDVVELYSAKAMKQKLKEMEAQLKKKEEQDKKKAEKEKAEKEAEKKEALKEDKKDSAAS